MDRRKLPAAALFLTVLGAMFILPPLVGLFAGRGRLFGTPVEIVYLFAVWFGLVLATAVLSRLLPHAPPPADDGEG